MGSGLVVVRDEKARLKAGLQVGKDCLRGRSLLVALDGITVRPYEL